MEINLSENGSHMGRNDSMDDHLGVDVDEQNNYSLNNHMEQHQNKNRDPFSPTKYKGALPKAAVNNSPGKRGLNYGSINGKGMGNAST